MVFGVSLEVGDVWIFLETDESLPGVGRWLQEVIRLFDLRDRKGIQHQTYALGIKEVHFFASDHASEICM